MMGTTRTTSSLISLLVPISIYLLAVAEGFAAATTHNSPSATTKMIRFFNSGSCPYAQRSWIALEECQVDYEMVTVDLENKPREFLDLYAIANPLPGARAKVPLLEVVDPNQSQDPILLAESLVVTEYIAEQHGTVSNDENGKNGDNNRNVLLPASAKERATMRLFTELCGSTFSYFPLLRAKGDKLEAAITSFREGLVAADAFLKHYKSCPFLLGEQFSIAECNLAPFVQRACIILPAFTGASGGSIATVVNPMDICDELGLLHLKRWMEALLERPSVIATGVPKEELLKKTTKMMERLAAMEK